MFKSTARTRSARQSNRKLGRRLRPRLESLEGRQLLAVTFTDPFEGSSLNPFWNRRTEVSGYLSFPSTERPHAGSQSLKTVSTSSSQHKDIVIHKDFGAPTYGSVSIWVYDTGADRSSSNYLQLSIGNTVTNKGAYIVVFDYDLGPTNGGEHYYGDWETSTGHGVDRTQAWHRWTITATPGSVVFQVDGVTIGTSTNDRPFNTISIGMYGPNWRPAWTGYFDDFSFIPYSHFVTNTNDSGPGSLRQAILDANANGTSVSDTIVFNIPTTDPGYDNGVFTIQPLTELPALRAITLDGATQTAFTGNTNTVGPEVVINGALQPTGSGLRPESDCTIANLVINGFNRDANGHGIVGVHDVAGRNVIRDCYVGTDPTGMTAVPNDFGVSLQASVADNRVEGNLISGNGFSGIAIQDSHRGIFRANKVGTNRTGSGALPNQNWGIFIGNSTARDNRIEENLIAFNGYDGVYDSTDYRFGNFGHQRNSVRRNSIHSNGGIGFNIIPPPLLSEPVGTPTPNDLGDADEGGNRLQNFPVLVTALASGATTSITGTLNSMPNRRYEIELFANTALDPTGYGEGETYLGMVAVTTDASGNASFTYNHSGNLAGKFLSSTATDPDGNTSEFSLGRLVVNQGSFANPGVEAPSVGNGFLYNPANAVWTFVGPAGVSGNGSAFTSGNPNAPEGSQVAFLQATGSMSQSVHLAAGSYRLTFRAAQRGNYSTAPQELRVRVNGATVGNFTPSGSTYGLHETQVITVAAGTHTILFQGLDATGANTAFVDDLRIAVAPPPNTNLGNPGFEAPSVGNGFVYNPTGATWTFVGPAGISGNGSAFTLGNPNAPDGTQVAFLQGTGSMRQSVTLSAGNYRLEFRAAQRGNYGTAPQGVRVLVGGVVVATLTPAGSIYENVSTAPFSVAAGAHTILFESLDATGVNTAFIDAVSLNPFVGPIAQNAGFEVPVVSGGFVYNPTGAGWTFTGSAGVSGNGSAFTSGNPAAPEGVQVAFLQGTGAISQSVSNWAAGNYRVRFKAAQRGNYRPGPQDIRVKVDGNIVGTFTPLGTTYAQYETPLIAVTAGAHTIAFEGLDATGVNTAFLDDVQIIAS